MDRPFHPILSLVLAAAFCCGPVGSSSAYSRDDYRQQRLQFVAAEQAAKKGQWRRYDSLAQKLQDYPLYPYLEYQSLRKRLRSVDDQQIQAFLHKNAGTPIANRLRSAWLKSLARRGQWQTLVNHFAYTNNKKQQCLYVTGLLKLGEKERAFSMLEALWLTGRSLPRSCDQPIAQWRKQGGLTQARVWQRIRLAMQSGRSRLGRYLGRKYLPSKEQYWVSLWSKVRRKPDYTLKVHERFHKEAGKQPDALRWLLIDGLRRMAYNDPIHTAEQWQAILPHYAFTPAEIKRLERRLAIKLVEANSPQANQWLQQLKLSTTDNRLLELYALSALRDQDWSAALQWLNRLRVDEDDLERLRYWRARSLEALGHLDEARQLYLQNADTRSYYSFLASDRVGLPYQLSNRPIQYPNTALADMKSIPSLARAGELFWLNRIVEARREWNYTLQRLDKEELLKAAELAHRWGWHDRSITTFSQASYWDDLDKRFPLAHRELVEKYSAKNRLNPAWAYAIIRQESAFTADAKSHAGALGLMQLLPRTARQMARSLRLRRPKQRELLKANTNIRLGISYLNRVQKRFRGHPILATAAYNAGGYRVKTWLPDEGTIPADLWVELVPFNETRNYLQRVMTYTVIYEQRLGLEQRPLLERMAPIQGPVTVISQDKPASKPKA